MAWFAFAEGRRIPLVEGMALTVGRDPGCDIVVSDSRVSRHHSTIELSGTGEWIWTDQSANGSFVAGQRVARFASRTSAAVHVGHVSGHVVVITDNPDFDWESIANAGGEVLDTSAWNEEGESEFALKELTRIGRTSDNDIVLTGPLVSAHHAHVLRLGDAYEVIDLASSRGTYVNGARVSRRRLQNGDIVSLGGNSLEFMASGALLPITDTSGIAIEVDGLTFEIDGKTLLDNVTFTIPARKVLAVVGPSGSGKSTTLTMLAGIRPPTSGTIKIGGRDLVQEYENLRYSIGMVPQQDLVPSQLKVKEAIDFAARLRFSRDVSSDDREKRVNEVVHDLGLAERSDLRIDRLSGGQRKRVSVALEMLTKPPVLYLDEPTSGLDPGLDRQVMTLLRELADMGRTVVVVTHAVENLALADLLLVLAPGGHVAYFGSPAEAPNYFNVSDLPSVFLALETAPGHEWARRWRAASTGGDSSDEGEGRAATPDANNVTRSSRVRFSDSFSQFTTLVERNARVVFADKSYAILLAVLPLVLALTGFLVGGAEGLGLADGSQLNTGARFILTVFVLGAVFTGASTSIQELVKDRVIYQRERAVGLSRHSYVLAKVVVLGIIAALQGLIFASLSLVGRPGPVDPVILPWSFSVIVSVTIATVVSCMLGLMLSTLLPTRDSALPTLVIVTMVQVVLSGAIPLRFEGLLDVIGPVVPGYWLFESMASSIDLSLLLGDTQGTSWVASPGSVLLGWGVMVVMGAAFVVATLFLAARHDPGRK